jgi:hypothetical protein
MFHSALPSVVGKYEAVIGIVNGLTALFITGCFALIGYFMITTK